MEQKLIKITDNGDTFLTFLTLFDDNFNILKFIFSSL